MRYGLLGKTGVEVSALGFGCMRLPIVDGKPDQVDEPKATELLRAAIDGGINYVDTAYFYHAKQFGQAGASEPWLGKALSQGGLRDRVNLVTKLPTFTLARREQMDAYLAEQLDRLQTDYLDFYLLHGINGETWDRLYDLGALDFLDGLVAEGRIRFPAFSFHGELEDFKRIVDAYDWAFAQIQYNYMDIDYQAGLEGLRYAADKGIGVVVMEPLKGGKLADKAPGELKEMLTADNPEWSPAEWALRYVWDDPGVSMLLSGMSSMEQLEENLGIAERALPRSLSAGQREVFPRARELVKSRIIADCTACGYCQPCPSSVDIPKVLAALNKASMWDDPNKWASGYLNVEGKASLCDECAQCEEICPQGLPIRDLMRRTVEVFGD